MKTNLTTRRTLRGNPFLRERIHDPYRAGQKLRQATRCPQCGVSYRNGRWVWPKTASSALKSQLCPACRRINDDYPAGEVVLSGSFIAAHRDDILATIRNCGEAEQNLHPLHRIIDIDTHGEEITVTTTDVHLPHRIAHALKDAFGGTLKTHYDLDGYFTRASWERSD